MFVEASSAKTWNDYKKLSKHSTNEYHVNGISINQLSRIDSTDLGKILNEDINAKSLYVVSIKNNINSYYPCILLAESYHADKIEKSLLLFMVDSTFTALSEPLYLSSEGQDFGSEWTSYATVSDSTIQLTETTHVNCDEFPEDYSSLRLLTTLKMKENGEITTTSVDTLNIEKCPEKNE